MSAALLKALAPIFSRVRRDAHAVKGPNGVYRAKVPNSDDNVALTDALLLGHLDGSVAPRGAYLMQPGESTTRLALLDLDSHKGATSWLEMQDLADRLAAAMRARGLKPHGFRSSGGRGIHLICLWKEPQDAYSVRQHMRLALGDVGLADGAKGVSGGEVEVFPKQDEVAPGKWGNMFVLPLAGQSVPLDPDLMMCPMAREDALTITWQGSDPVPALERPERAARTTVRTADLDLVRSLLAAIPNDGEGYGYDEWVKMVSAVHHESGGSDEGYEIAFDFSARSIKFVDESELRVKVWDWLDGKGPTDNPATIGTLRHYAMQHGWSEPPLAAEEFPVLEDTGEEVTRVLDPKNSMGLARAALQARDVPLLRTADLWYEHTGPCWAEVPEGEVRSGLWRFLDSAKKEVTHKVPGGGRVNVIEPFCPTLAQVGGALDALRAVAGEKGVSPPCWLPGCDGPDAREIVSLTDGLLHIPTRALMPHTQGFFSVNTLPFSWGEGEREPVEWLKFLEAVWPGDIEAQRALQEMFGYLLTGDTSQQKMFLIRGPRRSGKGTIGRVLTALLGRENIVSPTLTSLTSNFGLQPLIGKLVATIPDARVGSQTNTQAVVEKLLMVSGEDSVTVDRKNKEAWTGTLAARIVIMTNETPQLGDASGALAGRFINISMHRSFFGEEDHGLTNRLLQELPGIFRWALDGRDSLKARGYFVQPASAQEDAEELAEANSPVTIFVDEVMEMGAEYTVPISEAYEAWRTWCGQNGRSHPGTKQTFSKAMRAAYPEVQTWMPRVEGERVREFTSIRIKLHVRAELGLFG